MTLRHVATFALFGGLMLLPSKAFTYCAGWDESTPGYGPAYYSVSNEFRRSKYIVKARVVREIWIGEDGKEKPLQPPFQNGAARPWGFDPYAGAYYDVKVLQVFKGSPKPELRLFSENSTARFWLDVGSDYILFVFEGSFDPPIGGELTIDNCGNSAAITNAQATVHSLEELSKSR